MLDTGLRRRSVAAGTEEREFPFTTGDFQAIAALLRDQAGISLANSKAPLVYGRLARRVRALQLNDFGTYVAFVQSPAGEAERRHMLTALTTNVTSFFREAHHFEHLRTEILQSDGGPIRLWSAACSTGQEAYSLAAVIASLLPDQHRLQARILATDIDPVVLQQAQAGQYSSIDGVPPGLRQWFPRSGAVWTVDPALRRMISFKLLNLNAEWPIKRPFDAVLCRNVAIYFDPEHQARLWSALAAVIRPGGSLCIGHSERVSGPATGQFENIGMTTYRRRSDPA
ncbi:MAG: protein-glutamate O-methyltransferase [Pseudomonadota bacterium]|nr:protein-glutamate O-methyltransferase [Pseudomonadota bacterium]